MREADDHQAAELSFLTVGKRVIPLVWEYASLVVTDIKLPDLVVSNHQSTPVTPVEIQVVGAARGKKIAASYLGRDHLVDAINQVNPQFEKLLASATTDVRNRLAVGLGEISVDGVTLSDNATIGSGQCAVILLSQIPRFFHVVGVERIDTVEIILSLEGEEGAQTATMKIPLDFHRTEVRYVFPVRGNVTIQNLPMNYLQHRKAHSQEFAFDVIAELPSANGNLVSCRKEASSDLSDYHIYRREVLAAADGVVVEVGNSFPEEDSVSPEGWTQTKSDFIMERLAPSIGFQNALSGNYITIEHAPGEFSLYAHLSQDSMRVAVGDKVKAGQVIALVGSTGNSSEPHLHFQVMDSRDFFTANGLPVRFDDLPADKMNQNFTSANTIALSDTLHFFMPEINQLANGN